MLAPWIALACGPSLPEAKPIDETSSTSIGPLPSSSDSSPDSGSTGSSSTGSGSSGEDAFDPCSTSPTVRIYEGPGEHRVFDVFADPRGWVAIHGAGREAVGPEQGGLFFSRPDAPTVRHEEVDPMDVVLEPLDDRYLLCWDDGFWSTNDTEERCRQLDSSFESLGDLVSVPYQRPRAILSADGQLVVAAADGLWAIDELGHPQGGPMMLGDCCAYDVAWADSWLVAITVRDPECFSYPSPTPPHCRVEAATFGADGTQLSPFVDAGPYEELWVIPYAATAANDRFLIAYWWSDEIHISVFFLDGTLLDRFTMPLDGLHQLGAYAVSGGFVLTDSNGARLIPLSPRGEPLGEPIVLGSSETLSFAPPVVGRSADGWAVAWAENSPKSGQTRATAVYLRTFGCAWPP